MSYLHLSQKLSVLDLYIADLRAHSDSMEFAWYEDSLILENGAPYDGRGDERGERNQYRVAILAKVRAAGFKARLTKDGFITLCGGLL